MSPMRESSAAESAYKHKRCRDILSVGEKMKILDMIEIEKESCGEIASLFGKNDSCIREVMKNKDKNTCYCFCCTENCKRYCYGTW